MHIFEKLIKKIYYGFNICESENYFFDKIDARISVKEEKAFKLRWYDISGID